MTEYTHDQLVDRARRWLSNRFGGSWNDERPDVRYGCPVVITEITTLGPETPDAIGWTSDGASILVECKRSRADFLADRRKPFRQAGFLGLGRLRYYMCPSGLLQPIEIPEGWGLLWVSEDQVSLMKSATPQTEYDDGKHILISMLRRVRIDDDRASVKVYTIASKTRTTLTVEAEA